MYTKSEKNFLQNRKTKKNIYIFKKIKNLLVN